MVVSRRNKCHRWLTAQWRIHNLISFETLAVKWLSCAVNTCALEWWLCFLISLLFDSLFISVTSACFFLRRGRQLRGSWRDAVYENSREPDRIFKRRKALWVTDGTFWSCFRPRNGFCVVQKGLDQLRYPSRAFKHAHLFLFVFLSLFISESITECSPLAPKALQLNWRKQKWLESDFFLFNARHIFLFSDAWMTILTDLSVRYTAVTT